MAGDISRSSFNPSKHFSAVRMQQGRVQTDADWNEQVDIAEHYARTAILDVIGNYGCPVADPGFGISVIGGTLAAGPGRMYVNGILCENPYTVLVESPGPGAPPPQPDLPNYSLPIAPGEYSIYLDVWERDITALEDPSILEIALGGIDTTTRTRVVWQLRWIDYLGSCTPNFSTWIPPSSGQMQAQAQPNSNSATPCAVPAQAGYSSLENQLYRVEVHNGGNAAAASFKWSRDNASVVAGWVSSPTSDQLVVTTLGKDQTLNFQGGDWVELTDDTHELNRLPGTLVQLSNAQMVGLSPTLMLNLATASGPTGPTNFPLNPKVRRWDEISTSTVILTNGAVPLTEGSWLPLENGVQVQFFPGGYYNTGDYWLIPARTATVMSNPTVVWPTDSSGSPLAQPALGITHSYAPLATVSLTASGWTVLSDCRLIVSPSGTGPAFHVVSTAVLQPAASLINDSVVSLTTFLNGFKITCDNALDPGTIKLATFPVTLDVPLSGANSYLTGIYPAATPLKLMANYTVGDSGDVSAYWIPTPQARSLVLEEMATFAAQTMNNGLALVSVTLRGNFVAEASSSTTLLNGPAYGYDSSGSIVLNLPSGNGQRGGNFEMWFWVPGYCDPTFPAGYMPFVEMSSIAGPDSSGDYVVVGEMTPQSFATMISLAEPDTVTRKVYCGPVQIAPGLTVIAYVPTALERGGNFSTFTSPIIDPDSGGPFPGNVIPASRQPAYLGSLARPDAASHAAVEEHAGAPTQGVTEQLPTADNPTEVGPVPDRRGIFAWRIRGIYQPPAHYGYGYGYASGVGVELV